jgi:hypothetical protein
MRNDKKVEIKKYFLSNIFEARSAYEEWKMIFCARSFKIIGKELAENYVKIQKYHPSFFVITERACLITFVMLICHIFDNRLDSCSLGKVNETEYEKFVSQNEEIIKQLKKVRNKIFAHRDIEINPKDIRIPSIEKMDDFFSEINGLYNRISKEVDNSIAIFDRALEIKSEI